MQLRRPLARLVRKVLRAPLSRLAGDLLVGPVPRPAWAPAGNMRDALAGEFIRGSGLEIGALLCPLFVPVGTRVTYLDKWDVPQLRLQLRDQPHLAALPLVPVDTIDDGDTLTSVAAASQDFIVANHFLEHVQDPIGTICRHLEVLKPGGILFLALPDKRLTFDARRPVTCLQHLYRDFEEGPAWSFRDHVREWVELVENQEGEARDARMAALIAEGVPSIHFHVWTQHELMEMLGSLQQRLALPFEVEAVTMNRHLGESICVLRKR